VWKKHLSKGLGVQVDRTASQERFKSLEACFSYTLNKLDKPLRKLLPKLTLFKSPFPISAVEIFNVQKGDITNLYNRSLLSTNEKLSSVHRIVGISVTASKRVEYNHGKFRLVRPFWYQAGI
jgi:hypothetical protein